MRESFVVIVLIIIAIVSAFYVIKDANNGVVAEDPLRTAVVADEQAGIVRIIIEGLEAARFDARGLHVQANINYGGSLTDSGEARTNSSNKPEAEGPR